ncbi:hypothetical protein [Aggregatibacter actinomycetemcomitans]|nr:hypothetical protein [Aggregatibacter actinomycetemcomitans]KYK73136.1 glycoside hydrolase family 19 [Aggregatibacter actinomycetemcomitans serotype e str. SA2876]
MCSHIFTGKLENQQGVGIYVDDSHVTHGILFPGVNVFKDETHEVSIFQHKIAEYLNPESELSIKDKESLKPVFKAILEELIWVIQKREMAQDLKEEV